MVLPSMNVILNIDLLLVINVVFAQLIPACNRTSKQTNKQCWYVWKCGSVSDWLPHWPHLWRAHMPSRLGNVIPPHSTVHFCTLYRHTHKVDFHLGFYCTNWVHCTHTNWICCWVSTVQIAYTVHTWTGYTTGFSHILSGFKTVLKTGFTKL